MIGIEQIAHVPSSFNVMMYSTSLFQCFQMIHHIVDPRPRQGKVDNRLLPGKMVKVSGKGWREGNR